MSARTMKDSGGLPYKWYFLFFVLLSLTITSIAQDSTTQKKSLCNTYIAKFNNKITLKLGLNNTTEVFSVKSKVGDSYILKPNPSQIIRCYFNYRLLSFFLSATPRFLPGNNDVAIKGKSKGFGLGFNFKLNRWFTELSFSENTGYYLENTKDFLPSWKQGDPYYQAPDLRITSFDGLIGFNSNRNHSLKAIWSQSECQLVSAGSLIPRLSFRYYITNDLSVGTTQKSTNFQTLLGIGYQHTFVVAQKIYLMGSVTPSAGYIFTKLITRFPSGNQITYSTNTITQLDFRAGLGYNSRKYFYGAYLTAISERFSQANSNALNSNGQLFFQVFAGIHIKPPTLLQKYVPNW